jgi:hypothetical protein
MPISYERVDIKQIRTRFSLDHVHNSDSIIFQRQRFYFEIASDLAFPSAHGGAVGMGHARQGSFFKFNKFQYQHGGELRRKRAGRGKRPLSTKDSLHVVFKMNREAHPQGLRTYKSYALSTQVINRFATRFFIKVIQVSIQGNHIHMLIRAHKRSLFHHFFRVVAGQIAQGLGRCMTDTPKPKAKESKVLEIPTIFGSREKLDGRKDGEKLHPA